MPAEQRVNSGGVTVSQVMPPLSLTAESSPRAPPSDQRSCCQTATMLLVSTGFTCTYGSTSESGKLTEPSASWPGTSSSVQPSNGLGPEICVSGPRIGGSAIAVVSIGMAL